MHESRALSTPSSFDGPQQMKEHLEGHPCAAAWPGLVEAECPLGKRLVYVCQAVGCVTGNSEEMQMEDIFVSLN